MKEMVGRAVSQRRTLCALIIYIDGVSSAAVLRIFNEFYCWNRSFVGFFLLYEGKLVAVPLVCRA